MRRFIDYRIQYTAYDAELLQSVIFLHHFSYNTYNPE